MIWIELVFLAAPEERARSARGGRDKRELRPSGARAPRARALPKRRAKGAQAPPNVTRTMPDQNKSENETMTDTLAQCSGVPRSDAGLRWEATIPDCYALGNCRNRLFLGRCWNLCLHLLVLLLQCASRMVLCQNVCMRGRVGVCMCPDQQRRPLLENIAWACCVV